MTKDYDHCQNCGTPLQGEYCHACGQRANEPRRAVIGLVQDVFVDTLWIDSRLWRTLGMLIWRPGRLARNYLDGRRMRYTPPFRMFLFASVFFFFFTFLLIANGGGRDFVEGYRNADSAVEEPAPGTAPPSGESPADETAAANDPASADTSAEPQEGSEQGPEREPDVISDEDITVQDIFQAIFKEEDWENVNYQGADFMEPIARQLYEAGYRAGEEPRLFIQSVKVNIPRVMLVAPVVYALLLAILYIYRWRKFVFYDHLIVSLYMHAALYSYLLIFLLAEPIPIIGYIVQVPLIIWALIQPFAVFRQAYGSNWVSVVLKGLISFNLYLLMIITLITFGLSYSLYVS